MHLAARLGLVLCTFGLGGLGTLAQSGCSDKGTTQPMDGGGRGDLNPGDLAQPKAPPPVSTVWNFEHPRPQGNNLYAIRATGADTYAAGDQGALVHLTDAAGTREAVGLTQNTLRALTGTSASLWAVGDGGIVLHGQNGSYTAQLVGITPLYAVWQKGDTVYAAGQENLLWTRTGTDFQSSKLPGMGAAAAIRGAVVLGNDVYLVGSGGRILHQQNGPFDIEGDGVTAEDLNSVAADADGSIYAVGVAGRVLRRDPVKATWTVEHPGQGPALTRAELRAVWVTASSVYAAAMDGTILRRSKTGWAVDNAGAKVAPGLLFSGSAAATGGIGGSWAAGEAGTLLRRGPQDGDAWKLGYPTTQVSIATLSAISTTDTGAYAVGQDGRILKRSGTGDAAVWAVDYAPTGLGQPLLSVSALAEEAYAVGLAGTVLHKTADKGWQPEKIDGAARPADLRGVWLHRAGASVDVYAVGSTVTGAAEELAVIYHKNGATWTQETITPDLSEALFSVNGNDSDVLAVGTRGAILHRGNAGWTVEGEGLAQDVELYSLAVSGGDFYAAGTRGTVMARTAPTGMTGASWKKSVIPQGGANLTALLAIGKDLWAVGGGGFAAHRVADGTWTVEPTLATSNLSGLAQGGTSLLAVGSGGSVLRRDLSGNK